MYQLVGAAALARWFAFLAAAFGTATMALEAVMGRPLPDGTLALARWIWTSLGSGIAAATFVVFVVGSSSLFPWLCRHRPLAWVFPDLDGTWVGALASNWPRVSNRQTGGAALPPLLPTPATLVIKARLLSISLVLVTDTKYSDSETILVGISRSDGGVPSLTYVYQNRTPQPLPTDSGSHHGAARLELRDEDGRPTLRGVYWTDRNWEKGLNTAGTAVFRKECAKPTAPIPGAST